MQRSILASLNEARSKRQGAILATDLESGEGQLFLLGDPIPDELAGAVNDAFKSGKSQNVEAGGRTFFLNVHKPPMRLCIIGAVHISQALAPMARMIGLDVVVIDPRTAFATDERFHGTELIGDWPQDVFNTRPLDRFTALAAVTHDPKIDDFPLIEALKAECFYIGALGSRKTHATRQARLSDAGITQTQFARIKAPIGLNIGASSPSEIAVAVLAEIIAEMRGRGAEFS